VVFGPEPGDYLVLHRSGENFSGKKEWSYYIPSDASEDMAVEVQATVYPDGTAEGWLKASHWSTRVTQDRRGECSTGRVRWNAAPADLPIASRRDFKVDPAYGGGFKHVAAEGKLWLLIPQLPPGAGIGHMELAVIDAEGAVASRVATERAYIPVSGSASLPDFSGIAVVRGHPWIGATPAEPMCALMVVDPATGRTLRRISTCPMHVGARGDDVWAGFGEPTATTPLTPEATRLRRLDPAAGMPVGPIFDVPAFRQIAVGPDAVWLLSEKLLKIDTASGAVLQAYEYEEGERFVVAPDGGVWIGAIDTKLRRITPHGDVQPTKLEGKPMTAGDGAVWVVSKSEPDYFARSVDHAGAAGAAIELTESPVVGLDTPNGFVMVSPEAVDRYP
jgi:hypothetical protein